MNRPSDPRGASRRGGTDASDIGYTVANGAPTRGKPPIGRKPRALPHTGCHMYQGASIAFPGYMQVWNRCPAHQPPGSADLGPVPGWCPQCEQSPEFQSPVIERLEY